MSRMSAKWLPESDAHQNLFPLLYEFPFGILNVRKGQKHIMPDEEYRAACKSRVRLPSLPSARTWLELAMQWQKRLQVDAGPTKTLLARELEISPTRLTHILNLLNLAPAIRCYILTMEPTIKRSPITERRLREIARKKEHALQLEAFQRLKSELHSSV